MTELLKMPSSLNDACRKLDVAYAEIDRLRAERDEARRSLWLIVASNGGYTLERADADGFPGEHAWMETATDAQGNVTFRAFINNQQLQTDKS